MLKNDGRKHFENIFGRPTPFFDYFIFDLYFSVFYYETARDDVDYE